jgi:hypothetical protein
MPSSFDLAPALHRIAPILAMHLLPAPALRLLSQAIGTWVLLSVVLVLSILAMASCYRAALRLKRAMAESDASPVREPDRPQRATLRLTRHPLTREQGAALESLHHAIDYLMQTYDLRQPPNQPQPVDTPQRAAVEILLLKRSEMLAAHPPLPSLFSLLRRRLTHLTLPTATRN